MKYRMLGNSGVKVSELCFGTMTFGGVSFWKNIGEQDAHDANELVAMAIDVGINFFDSADVYSDGLAEQLLGKALGTRRKDVILATKVRGRMGLGLNDVGLSRHHIIEGCHASLKRFGTEYIDLYQIHNFDHATPLEETLRALDDLVRAGKVRYVGCSNFPGWLIMKALAISEQNGWPKFITVQSYYSLMARELEFEIIPLCLDQGMGVLAWSPLSGGFLTGKYRRGQTRPRGARRSNAEGNFLQFDEEKGFGVVEELQRIAKTHHATIPQAALNYLLRKPVVRSIILGARTLTQLTENLKTEDWEMTPDEVARLDEVSKPPHIYPYWMQEFSKQDR